MITSLFHPISDPITDLGRSIAPKLGQMELPDLPDLEMPEYSSWMGFAYRAAVFPLMMTSPMGWAAVGTFLITASWVGSFAYDVYLHQDDIVDFIDETNEKHARAGTLDKSPFEVFYEG